MKTKIISIIIIITVLATLVIPQVQDFIHWKIVCFRNSPESYKSYFEKRPNGIYKTDSELNYDNKIWEKAKNANSLKEYKDYISDPKAKKNIEEAKNQIIKIEWETIKKVNSVKTYQNFLDSNLNSLYYDEAIDRLIKLKNVSKKESESFENIEKTNMHFKYENFIKSHKDSPLIYKARKKITDFKKIVFDKEEIITKENLKTKYNWDGKKLLWKWGYDLSGIEAYNGSIGFLSENTTNPYYGVPFDFGVGYTFGKVCIGNIQIDGKCELVDEGIKFYKESVLIYKIK